MSYANKDNYNFTPEEADELWVDTFGNVTTAKDENQAIIHREKYGDKGMYGWEIDHIWPKAKLEQMGVSATSINSACNLRPLHRLNNQQKSNDFPCWRYYKYDSIRQSFDKKSFQSYIFPSAAFKRLQQELIPSPTPLQMLRIMSIKQEIQKQGF